MKRKLLKLLRRIKPESGAHMRARIRREQRLKTIFRQGEYPLRHGANVRSLETERIVDDAAYYAITNCQYIRQQYGFA